MRLCICIACLVTLTVLSPPGMGADRPAVPVRVETVREEAIRESVQLTGTVTSARAASLSPATSGLVTTLQVDAGSRVKTGEILLELDPELARWQAQSAQAAEGAALVSLEDARRRLREARALAPQRSIAETVVHDLATEVEEDDAALQQARAEAGYRQAILERHRLRAPFDGVVAAKHTEVGEWVVPGDAVLELVSTGDLRIDFPVAEDYLGLINPGTRVTYTYGAAGGAPQMGEVATVVPVSDPGARTFLLRVDADTSAKRLVPGMSVLGRVLLDTGRRAPVVPRDAIIRYPDGRAIVWTVERGDDGTTVVERVVETGVAFEGLVEIRKGLSPNARIVVKGNESLQAGQPVNVVGDAQG